MSDQTPLNPVQVEEHIRELVNRIAKGIQVCSKRYAEFLMRIARLTVSMRRRI